MSNQTKHTPGPWHWNESETDKRSRPYVRCNIKLLGAVGNVAVARVIGKGSEMMANARLIAAAPELYEACQAAFLLLSEYAPIWAVRVEDQLREALAKVRE